MKLGAIMTPMRCLAVAAAVLVLVPVLSVAMPPLLDYPNHLVRYWLLSGGAAPPAHVGHVRRRLGTQCH